MDGYRAEHKLKRICAEAVYYLIDEHPSLRYANIVKLTDNMVSFSLVHIYPNPIPRITYEEHSNHSNKFIETIRIHLEYQTIEMIKKAVKESFVKYLLYTN